MTVSEFASIWSNFYTGNMEVHYTYKGTEYSLYNLKRIQKEYTEFKIELKPINIQEDSLLFYSDRYDLNNLDSFCSQIIDSLHIEFPENTFKNILIIHIN